MGHGGTEGGYAAKEDSKLQAWSNPKHPICLEDGEA